ncbi:anti-sigma factor family protein [Bosea thiooxidans]
MTDKQAMSWEQLNAYVDGELAPADAAAVASAVAHDAGLAARVATLARLRAVVAVLPSQPAPPLSLPLQARRRQGNPRWAALAASLVLAVLPVAGAYRFSRTAASPDGLSLAVQAQRQWLASDSPATRLPITLTAGGDGLPDLDAASLRLAYLSLDPANTGGGGVLAGYIGPQGCRLGLWIGPQQATATPQPVRADRDGLKISTWALDGKSYALLSRGMDSRRLDEVAEIVAGMPQPQNRPTDAQIARLRSLHAIGEPCSA